MKKVVGLITGISLFLVLNYFASQAWVWLAGIGIALTLWLLAQFETIIEKIKQKSDVEKE